MARSRWFLSVPAALICLFAVDIGVAFWKPNPQRLPEQFSPAYLDRVVTGLPAASPIVFLGDSVLWGYRLPAADAAPTLLAASFPRSRVLNLSYEGGSSANSYFMLRYLLARGVRPAAVVFNINSKESNPEDSAYRRLHPSLEPNVAPLLESGDRARLDLLPAPSPAARLDAAVAAVWKLYRYRTDVREALFGADDAATWLKNAVQNLTGSQNRQAAEHQPTADRFMGTYDLEPLTEQNVDYLYLRELGTLLKKNHIPAVAFLTPTNHRLLHDYIESPTYDKKLAQLASPLRQDGITVLDLDRSFPGEFLDNDHLTPLGNRRLAAVLAPQIRKVLGR